MAPPESPFPKAAVSFASAALTDRDMEAIRRCQGGERNELGMAYQIIFARARNRFPVQDPLEIDPVLLDCACSHLGCEANLIEGYGAARQQTVSEHRAKIKKLLGLRELGDPGVGVELRGFVCRQAHRLEKLAALERAARDFMRENAILYPADSTLEALARSERKDAREHICERMGQSLDPRTKANIKAMLRVEAETGSGQSRLQWLNSPLPASKPCPAAMNRLLDRIEAIKDSGVLEADLTWLDDNYARALADRARASSVHRLRELSEPRQLATVACFLVECYRETLDQAVRLHSRLESVAAKDAREQRRERLQAFRKLERRALRAFRKMTAVLLDESVEDAQARQALFRQVPRAELSELDQGLEREKTAAAAAWDQAAELLELRAAKTRQFRQYAPRFLRALEFRAESPSGQPVLQALETLKDLYRQGNKGLPEEASEDFARRRDKPALASAPKKAKRQLWEAAVLSRLREKIESGDVFVAGSKRYGRLDDMLLPEEQWIQARDSFYERAGLPSNPSEAREFLGNRLNQAYDDFLAASGDGKAPGAARVDSQTGRCQTPRDPAVQLSSQERRQLEELKDWIGASLRPVKLGFWGGTGRIVG